MQPELPRVSDRRTLFCIVPQTCAGSVFQLSTDKFHSRVVASPSLLKEVSHKTLLLETSAAHF